ncbi:alpha/beta fold hydrolase [Aquabacterium sp.]|uniref:alpha/beta fold hydrolase n=1 Tax=Aquabacterium sp. TaxID=1872578 RepID=UPI003783E64C
MSAAPPDVDAWPAWLAVARRLDRRFEGHFVRASFDYQQPVSLQRAVPPRLRRPYAVKVGYTDWGLPGWPTLVCCGGVANTAMRFAFLAADLRREGWRVVCMDWLGRGQSGWLADGSEYGLPTYVEQLRQLIVHLGGGPVALLGSSMGGSAAMVLAARHPELVSRVLLNDVGPHIPQARRARRAQTLARHYVFRTPADIMRRAGAAQKHDGPVGDDVRLFIAYHQTRWSDEDGGRVYRHDPRALLAYQRDAARSVDLWDAWRALQGPVLLMHGLESDALTPSTLSRMQRGHALTLVHVPDTGHTPVLSDRHQTALIGDWLREPAPPACALCVTHAPLRRAWVAG